MAGSMKDAFGKVGIAPVPVVPSPNVVPVIDELSDDESLPPRFEAPALTTVVDPSASKRRS